ncbi:MAG: hypothetical protein N3D14_00015 [Aquificaceae bacterium]|nr:hypothetical protein [Aquificaceae bacterium]MCX8163765.1 hypothetical protein [Aquificaceae bacterium]
MQKLNLKNNKVLAFIAGLVYGYKNARIELKTLSMEDFTEAKHINDKVYYLNRIEGKVYEYLNESVTHVCALKEDKVNGKVSIFIYKKQVK